MNFVCKNLDTTDHSTADRMVCQVSMREVMVRADCQGSIQGNCPDDLRAKASERHGVCSAPFASMSGPGDALTVILAGTGLVGPGAGSPHATRDTGPVPPSAAVMLGVLQVDCKLLAVDERGDWDDQAQAGATASSRGVTATNELSPFYGP